MLTDSFNRIHDYLRISLTDKCNLRCAYCNPVDLPKGYFAGAPRMSADEIDRIAAVFVNEGVKKSGSPAENRWCERMQAKLLNACRNIPLNWPLAPTAFLSTGLSIFLKAQASNQSM